MISKKIYILILFLSAFNLFAQNFPKVERTGKVSFVTSQNIYVRFDNTEGIVKGDTLYSNVKGKLTPAVIVQFISTTSCSGIPVANVQLKSGDELKTFVRKLEKNEEAPVVVQQEKKIVEKTEERPTTRTSLTKRVNGGFSISSYSSLSNTGGLADFQNWRFSLSLDADSLLNTPVSLTSYINFAYRADRWNEIQNNIGDALRIYDLALNYKLGKQTSITLGRRINPKTSSLGALDGLQFETAIKKFVFGVLAGSRPSFSDYGYDVKMFEYGGYVYRSDSLGSVTMQNTIGVFQQTNNFKTDRRFFYFQHTNNLSQNLSFFVSSEFDLYKRKKGVESNIFDLTSLFVYSSYSPSSWMNLSLSYDARKNVMYYETFKSFADSVLESATRQGLGLRVNLRPFNYIWFGFNFGYRFSKDDPRPSKNFGANLNYMQLPLIYSSLYLNYNRIESGYVNGNYYGAALNKDIFNGEVNLGVGYKRVDYSFPNGGSDFLQNIGNVDLSWRIFPAWFLTISYEGTFQEVSNYTRIFMSLNTRF